MMSDIDLDNSIRPSCLTMRILRLGFRGPVLALLALVLLFLGPAACSSHGPTSSASVEARLDGSAIWSLMSLTEREGIPDVGEPSRRSLQVVVENRLRALGARRVVDESDRMTPVSSSDSRYAVSVQIDEWPGDVLPGRPFRLGLQATVRDVIDDTRVWSDRVSSLHRTGTTRSMALDRTVARLFRSLTIEPERRDRDDGDDSLLASIDASGALLPVADIDAASVSMAPAQGFGLRTAGRRLPAVTSDADDAAAADAFDGRATAFHYAANPPVNLLRQFDRVVLEPDNVNAAELAGITAAGARAYAYLSIGEVGPERPGFASLAAESVLGRNAVWNSAVMDLTSAAWNANVLARVDALADAGYDGLFLDTMDSYTLYATTSETRSRQADAMSELLARVAARQPDLRLIANRGFEVLDRIAPHLEAIAAESLYSAWDNVAVRHRQVSVDDRSWLLGQLTRARDEYGLDVIAIDYVAPGERDQARDVAARIASHGIVPWVATPALDHVGVGTIDVLPRDVLMLFDSRINGALADAEVHRLLATPLEYLGYVPVYHDLAVHGIPAAGLGGRYHGVVMWNRGTPVAAELQSWFLQQVEQGVPLALFGAQWLIPDSALASSFGIDVVAPIDAASIDVRLADELVGFEHQLPPRFDLHGRQARSVAADNRVHLSLQDGRGETADIVVSGPWGGFATHPGAVEIDIDGISHWIIDPFEFLRLALHLPNAPMPDVTTEQGKRLWLAHIDGDALPSWAELPGRKLGAEIIRDRILDRYPLPHTISIVEAEMTSIPAYADRRDRMFKTMRDIYARHNVEIASHTFSHPFYWERLAQSSSSGTFNLPVGDYVYDPKREVAGSARFIDKALAPPGKRTQVMLWSGDALPGEPALAAADEAGLANLNGGFTTITRAAPALSLVSPMARTVGKRVQVYAPIMNENIYTNDWTGPFDGFRRVIETFELTDRPRRLKPLSIYYHFYAGTKPAAVRSLEEVYAWSVKQAIHPTTVSAYSNRVRAYREAGVARRLDGSWQLSSLGPIRSLRVLGATHRIERPASEHVTNVHRLHDGLYLDTDGSASVRVGLADPPGSPTIGQKVATHD